jgi:hypothetical protein
MASAMSEIITKEERQLWECLKLREFHADACACRLHLSLAMQPYGETSKPHWDLESQVLAYVRKRHLVSANCALPLYKERELLNQVDYNPKKSPELSARNGVLERLINDGSEALKFDPGLFLDDVGYDRFHDTTCLQEASMWSKLRGAAKDLVSKITDKRPEKERMKGFEALMWLDYQFSGFATADLQITEMVLYELFTGTVSMDISDTDDNKVVASILLRTKIGQSTMKDLYCSILRTLNLNRHFCDEMPKWGSDEVKKKTWFSKEGTNSVEELFKAAANVIKSKHKEGSLTQLQNMML